MGLFRRLFRRNKSTAAFPNNPLDRVDAPDWKPRMGGAVQFHRQREVPIAPTQPVSVGDIVAAEIRAEEVGLLPGAMLFHDPKSPEQIAAICKAAEAVDKDRARQEVDED